MPPSSEAEPALLEEALSGRAAPFLCRFQSALTLHRECHRLCDRDMGFTNVACFTGIRIEDLNISNLINLGWLYGWSLRVPLLYLVNFMVGMFSTYLFAIRKLK